MEGGPQEPQFEIRVPAELEGGAYSNIVGVWHTEARFGGLLVNPQWVALAVHCELLAL